METTGGGSPADGARIDDLAVPVTAEDHSRGPENAPVTLVEYADYECPYSGRAYHLMQALRRELGDELRFVYRNFPLRSIHPHAQHAAEAAEAAAAQESFWAMHDRLFEQQQALEDGDLRRHAAALGLDPLRFDRDLAQHTHAARIETDLQGGIRSGVAGTPTFFVNGVLYEGGYSLGPMLRTIREAEMR